MEKVNDIAGVTQLVRDARANGRSIALVPTMGFLHPGHGSLIARARAEAGYVVVSIFVNPAQFGPSEDYRDYPRDLDRDTRLAADAGADLIFSPSPEEMYPRGYDTFVEVPDLSAVLCGASRPGHFRGVATVVLKLLNIVRPDVAFFGQKDAQQLLVIRRLVADLNVPGRIVAAPTVREPDGLAMSSRNAYLDPEQRRAAPAIYRALQAGEAAIGEGERDPEAVVAVMRGVLAGEPLLRPDYVAAVDAATLRRPPLLSGRVLLAVAARLGRAKLIDNLALDVAPDIVRRITL